MHMVVSMYFDYSFCLDRDDGHTESWSMFFRSKPAVTIDETTDGFRPHHRVRAPKVAGLDAKWVEKSEAIAAVGGT